MLIDQLSMPMTHCLDLAQDDSHFEGGNSRLYQISISAALITHYTGKQLGMP